MSRRPREIRTQRKGYLVTKVRPAQARIVCHYCDYHGPAALVISTGLGAGQLYHCPECKSLNISAEDQDMTNVSWQVDEWQNCYPSNWKGLIVAEAMSHPAKYSSRLIRRIYEHLLAEGWLARGDTVLDPFGGVALGALDAMRLGLRWRGVELEPKFAELGAQNIAAWHGRFQRMPFWSGSAVLFRGDSRKLLEVIGAALNPGAAVSSPPYSGTDLGGGGGILTRDEKIRETHHMPTEDENYGVTPGQLGNMKADGFDAAVSSPPYQADVVKDRSSHLEVERMAKKGYIPKGTAGMTGNVLSQESYGHTEGQLGNMKADGFDAAVSSPPFGTAQSGGGINVHGYSNDVQAGVGSPAVRFVGQYSYSPDNQGETLGNLATLPMENFSAAVSSPPFRQAQGGTPEPKPGGVIDERLYARHAAGNSAAEGYGTETGQLANMAEGDFQAAVSSPPFQESLDAGYLDPVQRVDFARANGISNAEHISPIDMEKVNGRPQKEARYGFTDGQLGADSGDDFWLAARQIVEQVYLALAPGGHAAWVCKDFVKDGERVPFADQWRQLCEAVGFVTLHEHHALLVKHKGASHTLEGGLVEHRTEAKSFFRRLAEKKGSPRIDWEVIYCMEKPNERTLHSITLSRSGAEPE